MRARHANSSRPACLHVAVILALAFLAAASQVTVQDALTLSVVVIAHPPHFHYLPAVFENVAQQSAPPEELLICASGVTGLEALAAMVAEQETAAMQERVVPLMKEGTAAQIQAETNTAKQERVQAELEEQILMLEKTLGVRVRVLYVNETLNAAQNRNRGIRAATSDLIAMVDVDDVSHLRKFELVRAHFMMHLDAQLFLHSYEVFSRVVQQWQWPGGASNVFLTLPMAEAFLTTRLAPDPRINSTNLGVLLNEPHCGIHHAHVTFRRGLDIWYDEKIPRGEDGTFCRAVWHAHRGRVYFSSLRLVGYRVFSVRTYPCFYVHDDSLDYAKAHRLVDLRPEAMS